MCPSVEAGSDRPESLLTSRVPLKQKRRRIKRKCPTESKTAENKKKFPH